MQQVTHHYAGVNGIRMHYVAAGSGPLLLLLHGFPEFWYSWRHQFAALSPYFRVVAPDLRGYNDTDKPGWGYEADVLAADVLELVRVLGYERAIIAGHDWGGALAWLLAMQYPHRVERLIVLNMPHPVLFLRAMGRNPRQMVRSLYMGFFQLPWLPEWLLSTNDYALLELLMRKLMTDQEGKPLLDEEAINTYKDAISKPGALTAALNWYRSLRGNSTARTLQRLQAPLEVPTLLLWGQDDPALGVELTYGTEQYAPNLCLRYIPGCSHWVQQERPDLVNQSILAFVHDKDK
jgi:pimeloyl-ACP methyl ester carboxylesterase